MSSSPGLDEINSSTPSLIRYVLVPETASKLSNVTLGEPRKDIDAPPPVALVEAFEEAVIV